MPGKNRLPRKQRIEKAIQNTSDGFFQLRTVLILGLGNSADAVEILSIGYILAVYEDKEGALTRAQQGVLGAAIFAGMLTGGLFFGALSDQIGRRKTLLYSLSVNGIFALLSSIAPNIYFLIAFRTLAGVGIGGTLPIMFTLCSEHVPIHRRGYYVTILASFWMVGSIFTAALAWLMLGNPNSGFTWREFAAIVSLPSFTCIVLTYLYVPESAQYFARQRLFSDAEEVLNLIITVNGKVNEKSQLISPYGTNPPAVASYSEATSPIVSPKLGTFESYGLLFDPVLRPTTISLWVSWFCLSFGSYGLATWITVLFKRINLLDPFANAFFYAAANLPGNLLSAFLMDKVGGKGILFGSLMMASVCAGLFAYVSSGNASAFVIITLACSFNAFSTSGWNAIDLMSAESFPTDVRTTGMGFLSAGGRIGSVFAQLVNGYLIGPPAHVELLLSITAIMMLLGGVSCFFVRDQSGKVLLRSVSQLRNQTNYSSYSEDEGEDDLKNSTTLNLPHR